MSVLPFPGTGAVVVVVVVFYLNSQYQTGNKPNYMEANKGMLRMRHWGGCYFKWKILIPGGTKNRYNENLKRPWYCRLPCWKQLHGEGKTTRKTFYLMYWTNSADSADHGRSSSSSYYTDGN